MKQVIQDFIQYQKLLPDPDSKKEMKNLNAIEEQRSQQVMDKIMGLVREHRESLQSVLEGLDQKKNSGESSGSTRFKI